MTTREKQAARNKRHKGSQQNKQARMKEDGGCMRERWHMKVCVSRIICAQKINWFILFPVDFSFYTQSKEPICRNTEGTTPLGAEK
jgi:hypothetical protein